MLSDPGLSMIKTPTRPKLTATHRRSPTFSPKKKTANAVIARGAIKNTAVASAIGIDARPRKNNIFAITTQKPRKIWRIGRFVFRFFNPPSRGIKMAKVKTIPINERVNTT